MERLKRFNYGAEKSPEGHDIELELHHPMTGELSQMATFLTLGSIRQPKRWDGLWEVLGSKRNGMDSTFHLLCPRYNGPLTLTVLMAIRL